MPRRKQKQENKIPAIAPEEEEEDELIELNDGPTSMAEMEEQKKNKVDVKPKKERKENPWVNLCREVKARPENENLSYREILKKAKLEYVK